MTVELLERIKRLTPEQQREFFKKVKEMEAGK